MKKILIINGHPILSSFNSALAESYKRGAIEGGAEIREIKVADLPLENYLRYDYNSGAEVGKEIIAARADITWADHIVFFHPVWWGSMPAILKCFIDIVFMSGFAFRFEKGSMFQKKLLVGKTAHIVTTLDTPYAIYHYLFGAPSVRQLKSRTLEFCGISPVKVSPFGPIESSTKEQREKFLNQAYLLGKKLS